MTEKDLLDICVELQEEVDFWIDKDNNGNYFFSAHFNGCGECYEAYPINTFSEVGNYLAKWVVEKAIPYKIKEAADYDRKTYNEIHY